ncbi:MAG: hypothetical protein IKP68_09130 [Clostridia bacterium]|nr:hypothetical protein [Clostridia bacterium]
MKPLVRATIFVEIDIADVIIRPVVVTKVVVAMRAAVATRVVVAMRAAVATRVAIAMIIAVAMIVGAIIKYNKQTKRFY